MKSKQNINQNINLSSLSQQYLFSDDVCIGLGQDNNPVYFKIGRKRQSRVLFHADFVFKPVHLVTVMINYINNRILW